MIPLTPETVLKPPADLERLAALEETAALTIAPAPVVIVTAGISEAAWVLISLAFFMGLVLGGLLL